MSMNILVVEDDAAIRSVLQDTMLDAGFRVTEARNGVEGLQAVTADTPDLILLDLMMPLMDGLTMLRHLSASPATASIPVVMLTARTDTASIAAAFAAGVTDYIPKPVDIRLLEHRVRTLIAARRNEAALERCVAERTAQLEEVNAQLRQELRERVRTEAALNASEQRFQTAAESSLDAFSILESVRDDRGRIVDFFYAELNRRAEELFGRTRAEVRGKPLRETFPITFANGSFEKYVRVVETKEPLQEEVFLDGLAHGPAWLHRQITPIGDNIAITTRDITPQKQLEAELQHERDLLHMLLDNIPDAIYFKDTSGRFTRINAAQARILGVATEIDALGKTDHDFFPTPHAQTAARDEQHLVATGIPVVDKLEHVDCAVEPKSLSTTKVPLRDTDGQIVGLVGISRDITERIQRELALHVRDQAIAAATDGIVITGPSEQDCPIIYANPAFERLTGYSRNDVIGRNVRLLHGPATDSLARTLLQRAEREGTACEVVLLNYRQDGTTFWNALALSPVKDEHGRTTHFVGVHRDATPQKQAEAHLMHEALHDHLTGLANRVLFETRLQEVLADRRQHTHRFAVFFLDLDKFKAVNDNLGHLVGDMVLREVARRMTSCIRPEDIAARFGGDEFAILVDHVRDDGDAQRLADRLQVMLSQPMLIDGHSITVSLSIGIAIGAANRSEIETLLRDADAAMYAAKHRGKEGAVLFLNG